MVDSRMLAMARAQLSAVAWRDVSLAISAPNDGARDARNAPKDDAWTLQATVTGRVMQPSMANVREVEGLKIDGAAYVLGVPVETVVKPGWRVTVRGTVYTIIRAMNEGTDVLYTRLLCWTPRS